jgi:hypothetical protein
MVDLSAEDPVSPGWISGTRVLTRTVCLADPHFEEFLS